MQEYKKTYKHQKCLLRKNRRQKMKQNQINLKNVGIEAYSYQVSMIYTKTNAIIASINNAKKRQFV